MTLTNFVSNIPYGLGIAAAAFSVIMLARWILSRRRQDQSEYYAPAPTPEDVAALQFSQQQDAEEQVLCPCGELATHVAPQLVRERMDAKQSVYALGPQYRRVVPRGPREIDYILHLLTLRLWPVPPVVRPIVCEAHAHVVDARMDQFIYTDIRAEQAKTNERIAKKAAEFETEQMIQSIRDNLTEEQRKKVMQLSLKRRRLQSVNGSGSDLQAQGN